MHLVLRQNVAVQPQVWHDSQVSSPHFTFPAYSSSACEGKATLHHTGSGMGELACPAARTVLLHAGVVQCC